jgi:hypothetical protein
MKVSELITKLQELDQDKMIVISGYEGGCDFPASLVKTNIMLNVNKEWYYGKHEYIHPDNEEYVEGEWNAYLLQSLDKDG